jgi:hypothetical protein
MDNLKTILNCISNHTLINSVPQNKFLFHSSFHSTFCTTKMSTNTTQETTWYKTKIITVIKVWDIIFPFHHIFVLHFTLVTISQYIMLNGKTGEWQNGKDYEESCHGPRYYPIIFQRTDNHHKIYKTASVPMKIWIRHLPNTIPLDQITWYCNISENFLTGVILKFHLKKKAMQYPAKLYCIHSK